MQLLIDKGEYAKAKDLLLSTPFQKFIRHIHVPAYGCRSAKKLNINCDPIPAQLGEDRLARFGAYREYE